MKLPQYRLLKISSSRKGTSIQVEWVDFVTCGECRWYNEREGCFFSTAEITADGFCSYGEREGE